MWPAYIMSKGSGAPGRQWTMKAAAGCCCARVKGSHDVERRVMSAKKEGQRIRRRKGGLRV